jgi:hypothetical protein
MPKFGNYCCPDCETILKEVPVPFGTSFNEHQEICPRCYHNRGGGRSVRMDWIPQIGRISAGGGPTFTSFETTGPDGKLHRINSITELRHMEREAEKMAADGVGQTMVWRDYANDRSNRYDHAITKNWEPDDYPGMPTKEQRQALRTLTQPEGEAKLVEMQKAAAEIASATAPPAEVG